MNTNVVERTERDEEHELELYITDLLSDDSRIQDYIGNKIEEEYPEFKTTPWSEEQEDRYYTLYNERFLTLMCKILGTCFSARLKS